MSDNLCRHFGFLIQVTVRSDAQIATVCRIVPPSVVNDSHMKTDVIFLWETVNSPDVLNQIDQNPDVDSLNE